MDTRYKNEHSWFYAARSQDIYLPRYSSRNGNGCFAVVLETVMATDRCRCRYRAKNMHDEEPARSLARKTWRACPWRAKKKKRWRVDNNWCSTRVAIPSSVPEWWLSVVRHCECELNGLLYSLTRMVAVCRSSSSCHRLTAGLNVVFPWWRLGG